MTLAWHIVRDSDGHYADTVRGTLADAELAASEYRTMHGLTPAHVVPVEPDYLATAQVRAMADKHAARGYTGPGAATHGYADYIQRHTAELLSRGIDSRYQSLGQALAGNDGD